MSVLGAFSYKISRPNCLSFSVTDYNYILFWNSLWTIAPVIGIGLFDRFLGESGHFSTKHSDANMIS